MRQTTKFKNNRLVLMVLGLLPLGIGRLYEWMILNDAVPAQLFSWLSAGYLLLWGLLAFVVRHLAGNSKEAALLLNFFAALDLLLIGIQEVLLGAYWPNSLGAWSQTFYLPPLSFSANLAFWGRLMFPVYLMSFGLMLLASWLGGVYRERR